MQLTNILAVAFLLAGSALANPVAHYDYVKPTHTKEAKPGHTTVSQTNTCSSGNNPYCCNTDNNGKYTTCKASKEGSNCATKQTTVCCNANDSIQICLGDINVG